MTKRLGRFVRQNTIALLALFIALGGTSAFAAATLINGKQIKPHTIAKNRLTNKAIAQLKGNRGPRGAQGVPGTQGGRGPTGVQGVQGVPGEAVAYALLSAAGAVDDSHSKNVTSANVRHPGAGQYCFHGLAFTPQSVQVTLGGVAPALPVPQVLAGASDVLGGFCNQAGDQAGVFIWNQAGSATVDYPFKIWFE